MELINVSAGNIHTVQIGSEAVRTAHLKAPLPEPWIISDDGVVGDQRAVHPDKLYAFARDSYVHWGKHLGVDPKCWPDGFFGENLTFDTLDETDIRIGDVFSLGEEVRLFVAGARNPCNKLSWRLSQPPTFQSVFAKSRRSGVYLGVDRPGRVRPGDQLRRIHHDSTMPSVAEVSAFIIDREPPPLGPLRRLLDYERLSATNRLLLSAKRDAAEKAADTVEGRWRGWRPFVLRSIVSETPDIRSVHLEPTDGDRLCLAKPGQFVPIRMEDGAGGAVTRCWSLSRYDLDPASYRVTVRKQDGPGSRRLHELGQGDTVWLRAPAGEFTLNRGGFRPVVLVAAGIGITPLKAMLDAQLARPEAPPVRLIYGARDPDALAFREELEALATAHPAFKLSLVYSRADIAGTLHGRITSELVIEQLRDLHITVGGKTHPVPWYEADIYICGPAGLCRDLTAGLVQRGANADRILHELFVAPPTEASEIEQSLVTFARSGREAVWRSEDDLSLLELAEANGLSIANSCRAGSCLTCRSRVIGGRATAMLDDATVLPCIGRPLTTMIQLDM